MPALRQRAQRAALIASLSAWPLLTLPIPTHATPTPHHEPVTQSLQQSERSASS